MSNYNELRLTYQGGSQTAITLTSSTISPFEYQNQGIVAVEVPEIVEEIGEYTFCDNNNLSSITLNEGLQMIHNQAFQHGIYSAITIPSTVTYIGVNAFNIKDEQDLGVADNLAITCLATTPPMLVDDEGITFGDPSKITAIYVPSGSVSDYQQDWPQYASKIQGGAAPVPSSGSGFTQADIVSAYVGTDLVEKIYIGSVLVWGDSEPGPTPVPTEYSAMPLTFKVLSAGTIQFARYDSAARTADTCEFAYKLNGVPGTFETLDTTPLIVNVQAGDIFEIYGKPATDFQKLGVGDGQSGSNTSYHSFSGSTAVMEVCGNLMSMCAPLSNIVANNIDRWDSASLYAGVYVIEYVITSLFRNMPGLVSAENLWVPYDVPAFGYLNLFKGSDALTVGPILQAEDLTTWCYASMYSGCSSLNDIVVTANLTVSPAGSNWSQTWVDGVPSNGSFYVHPDVYNQGYQNYFSSGQIPGSWNVYPAEGFYPSTIYLPTGQPLYDVTVKVFYPEDIDEVLGIHPNPGGSFVENARYENGYVHFDLPDGYDGTDQQITMDIIDKGGVYHQYTLTVKKEIQYAPVDLYDWLQQQQGTIITGTLGTVLYIPTATTIWGSATAGYLSADPSTPSTATSNYSVRFQRTTKYPSVKQRYSSIFAGISNAPTKTINSTLCYEYTFNEPLYITAQSTATTSWRQQISRNEVFILQET